MQPDVFEKLSTESLRGRIAREIREAILNGRLQQGERLVERKLASALGASLTAVREALVELESEGFVTKTPNSATHVTQLSWAKTEQAFTVRRVLEGLAVEEACYHASSEMIAAIERAYFAMLDAARTLDDPVFNRADLEFHLALWRATDNAYLEIALKRALLPYFAFGAIRIRTHHSVDLLHDAALHGAILDAVRAHDPEAGRQAHQAALGEWYAACRRDMGEPAGAG